MRRYQVHGFVKTGNRGRVKVDELLSVRNGRSEVRIWICGLSAFSEGTNSIDAINGLPSASAHPS